MWTVQLAHGPLIHTAAARRPAGAKWAGINGTGGEGGMLPRGLHVKHHLTLRTAISGEKDTEQHRDRSKAINKINFPDCPIIYCLVSTFASHSPKSCHLSSVI